MDLTKKYIIDKNQVSYRIIDGEAVILNFDNGYYYSLNEVGTKIWEAINKKKNFGEILNLLKEEYRLPEQPLKNDLLDLIGDLEKEKLVKKLTSPQLCKI